MIRDITTNRSIRSLLRSVESSMKAQVVKILSKSFKELKERSCEKLAESSSNKYYN